MDHAAMLRKTQCIGFMTNLKVLNAFTTGQGPLMTSIDNDCTRVVRLEHASMVNNRVLLAVLILLAPICLLKLFIVVKEKKISINEDAFCPSSSFQAQLHCSSTPVLAVIVSLACAINACSF